MKKKVLIFQFQHETNSFSPVPGDENVFKIVRYEINGEMFSNQRGVRTEVGGFLDALEGCDDIELIPSVALSASPSGPVKERIFDFVIDQIKNQFSIHKSFDGVLISLHGAMIAEGHPDADGDILEIVKQLAGKDVPVIATLDLHANVTEKMAKYADALVIYEHYPHIDNFETGYKAAQIMCETLRKEIKPSMAYRNIPYLLPFFPTDTPEMKSLYELARKLEQKDGVLCVRLAHGFFPSDIEDMGMAVTVVTDNDKKLAEDTADELKRAIEESIPNLKRSYPTLDEALDIALENNDGPVVFADSSDNPGAGAPSDTTHILRRILERGITGAAIATITDPESVEACINSGVGTEIELNLGGKTDPEYSGGPLKVKAYIKMITDGTYIAKGIINRGGKIKHGITVVVEIAGNHVIIASAPNQPYDVEIFRYHGITPEEQKILVTKSAIHYRASYGTVSKNMIALALPGYAPPLPSKYQYKNWKGNV